MAFNWFTNNATGCGKVEIVVGEVNNHGAFANPFKRVDAACTENNTVNKAVVTGLSPNTTYSFRVGGVNNNWSNIGTFTTAKATKEPFSFIYTTDPQAKALSGFQPSQIATQAAFNTHPEAKFWMLCGDMVADGSEINQWKDFFTAHQNLLLEAPFIPVMGNHDNWYGTNDDNFIRHFNTETTNFGSTDPTGSTYTFIYGDAQFFAINGEKSNNIAYINAVKTWMRAQKNAHPNIKWRIVFFHKCAYSGTTRQSDPDIKLWRQAMTPLFDELYIDLVIFGHDHIYQVIGPVFDKDTVPGSVSSVIQGTPDHPVNTTGKSGGTFDVSKGTLYFSNGVCGGSMDHKPISLENMPGDESEDVPNYRYLFTSRLGQIGTQTYSNVSVSSDTIVITTHKIEGGNSVFLDEIKITKYCEPNTQDVITYNSSQNITNGTLIIGDE